MAKIVTATYPIDVFWIARYDYQPGWELRSHTHPFHQLIYVLEGAAHGSVGGVEAELHSASVMFARPGVAHSLVADCGDTLKTLDTKFDVAPEDIVFSLARIPGFFIDSTGRLRSALEQMRLEGLQRRQWYREVCSTLLFRALIDVLREANADLPEVGATHFVHATRESELLERLEEIIDLNLNVDLTVRDLAAAVGYSPEHLTRKLRQLAHMAPHHFVMRHKIESAQHLLLDSQGSIKEIALDLGFKTIHHFTRAFSRWVGVPPARWRERERSGVWKNIVIHPGFVNTDITLRGMQDEGRSSQRRRTGESIRPGPRSE